MIILGKSYGNILLFLETQTCKLLFEAGYKAAGTNLQSLFFSSAAIKGLAVYGACIIQGNQISVLYAAIFYINPTGIVFPDMLQLMFHIVVRYSILNFLYFYALVLSKLYFRFYIDVSSQNQLLAIPDLNNIHIRHGNRFNAGFLNRFIIYLGKYFIYSILIKNSLTIVSFDYLSGGFPFAEPGNGYSFTVFYIRFLHSLFKCFRVYVDFQSYLFALQDLFSNLHQYVLLNYPSEASCYSLSFSNIS